MARSPSLYQNTRVDDWDNVLRLLAVIALLGSYLVSRFVLLFCLSLDHLHHSLITILADAAAGGGLLFLYRGWVADGIMPWWQS